MLHVPCHPVFICVLFVIHSRTIALWANVICCTYTQFWIKFILSYLYLFLLWSVYSSSQQQQTTQASHCIVGSTAYLYRRSAFQHFSPQPSVRWSYFGCFHEHIIGPLFGNTAYLYLIGLQGHCIDFTEIHSSRRIVNHPSAQVIREIIEVIRNFHNNHVHIYVRKEFGNTTFRIGNVYCI